MNGTIDFLLDTNFFLALVKHYPPEVADFPELDLNLSKFAISSITHMELWSFRDLTESEAEKIKYLESRIRKVPITGAIEESTIKVRRSRRLKLPDAIILATALETKARLLTLDDQLRTAFEEIRNRHNLT